MIFHPPLISPLSLFPPLPPHYYPAEWKGRIVMPFNPDTKCFEAVLPTHFHRYVKEHSPAAKQKQHTEQKQSSSTPSTSSSATPTEAETPTTEGASTTTFKLEELDVEEYSYITHHISSTDPPHPHHHFVHFKFIVDGAWTCDEGQVSTFPIQNDWRGICNHVLYFAGDEE